MRDIFRRGSRHQTEKALVLAGYLVLSAASIAWAFFGDESENELGASFDLAEISEINRNAYFIRNDSGDDWTGVRIVLDRRYLHTRPSIGAGERLTLEPEDFSYFYHIPRPWGEAGWEIADAAAQPGPHAARDYAPRLVEIRADQGRLTIPLEPGAAPISAR